jgi:glycosyltransferase involved in cell wall biosynthesis
MWGGIDFGALLHNLDIQDKVLLPNRYQYFKGLPPYQLAGMYNCADVFLGASMSEGFGIPIIEAQACGVPVIVGDYSSMPELVRWGYAVPAADIFWTPMNSWQWWPDVDGIQEALEKLYQYQRDIGGRWPIEARKVVSAKIHDKYDWNTIVADQWAPLISELDGLAINLDDLPDIPQLEERRIVVDSNGTEPEPEITREGEYFPA